MLDTVIITGAGSGIGRAIAKALSKDEYHLLLIGRRLENLKETANQIEGSADCLPLDLSNTEKIPAVMNSWISDNQDKKVIGLVNNAGQFLRSLFGEDEKDWDQLYRINLLGPVTLCRTLWPHFKKSGEGRIVNISSNLGQTPVPGTCAYSALKAALDNFSKTLALEGGPFNIRVNTIAPGLVDTPIHSFHEKTDKESVQIKESLAGMQPLERIGQPKDIAGAVSYFMNTSNSFTTGSLLNIDGGVSLTSRDPR